MLRDSRIQVLRKHGEIAAMPLKLTIRIISLREINRPHALRSLISAPVL